MADLQGPKIRVGKRERSVPPSAPRRSDPEVLERLMRAGVDVVRLNFSHGTAQDHIDRADAGARDARSAWASRWR